MLIERQRLLHDVRDVRDMHDGVGYPLIATVRTVVQGDFSRQGCADMLRAAIEGLRLAIDLLEPVEHDLTTLLEGVGSDPAAAAAGRGMVNMRHRAARLGGLCEITSSPGQGAGAVVALRLPLHRPPATTSPPA